MNSQAYLEGLNAVLRNDKGKPCGKGHIAEGKECKVGKGSVTSPTAVIAPVAAASGGISGTALLGGGAAIALVAASQSPEIRARALQAGAKLGEGVKSADLAAEKLLGSDKIPSAIANPLKNAQGWARLLAANEVAKREGYKKVSYDKENNIATLQHEDGSLLSIGSVANNIVTFSAATQKGLPLGEVVADGAPTYKIDFQVNQDFSADRKELNKEESDAVIKMVKASWDRTLENMPETALLETSAYDGDGKGKKRAAIYRRMGFQYTGSDKTDLLYAQVGERKIKKLSQAQLKTLESAFDEVDVESYDSKVVLRKDATLNPKILQALKTLIDTIFTGGIDGVLSYAMNEKGAIAGRFKDNNQIYDYSFSSEGELSYVESEVNGTKKDSYLEGLLAIAHFDAPNKKRQCLKGKPCKGSCISQGDTCREMLSAPAIAGLKQVQAALKSAQPSAKEKSLEERERANEELEDAANEDEMNPSAASKDRLARAQQASKTPFTQDKEYSNKLARYGIPVGVATAAIGAAVYTVQRDLERSQVPFEGRIPPDGVPDAETFAAYDKFQPGDLIVKSFKAPGWGSRQHYAVYIGKDPKTGQHLMVETTTDKEHPHQTPRVQINPLTSGAGPTSSDYSVVPPQDFSKEGIPPMSRDEIVRRAKTMVGTVFTYQGFDSNCEAFARGMVEGKAYSTQGDRVTGFTKFVSGLVTDLGSAIKVSKTGSNEEGVDIGPIRVGLSEYGKDKNRMNAQQMVDYLKRQKEMERNRRKFTNRSRRARRRQDAIEFFLDDSMDMVLDPNPPDPNPQDIFAATGMRSPKGFAEAVEVVAERSPNMANVIRTQSYKDYLMVLLSIMNRQNEKPARSDAVPNKKKSELQRTLEAIVYRFLDAAYNGVDRILSATVSKDIVSGLFHDGPKLMEYTINAKSGDIAYKISKQRSDAWIQSMLSTFNVDSAVRSDRKKNKCKQGLSCNTACISPDKTCRVNAAKLASPESVKNLYAIAQKLQTPAAEIVPTPQQLDEFVSPRKELEGKTIRELKKIAEDRRDIKRYSLMNKEQLIEAMVAADATPEQQDRIRKTLEYKAKERNLDPVRDWRKVAASKSIWDKGSDLQNAIKAGTVLFGLSVGAYSFVRDRYRGNFANSAATAESQAKGVKVEKLPKTKPYITFCVDGFSDRDAPNRGKVVEEMLRDSDPQFFSKHHMVSVGGPEFNELDNTPEGTPEALKEPIRIFKAAMRVAGTALIEGKNPQSVELAAQAYAYAKRYPDRQINMVGHSAGGLVIGEAAEILKLMPDGDAIAKNLRVVSLGTPYFGMTEQVAGKGKDAKGSTITISSSGDYLGVLPKLNGVMVNTVKGHGIEDYMNDPRVVTKVTGALGKNDPVPNVAPATPPPPIPRKNPNNPDDPRNQIDDFDWDNPAHVEALRKFIAQDKKPKPTAQNTQKAKLEEAIERRAKTSRRRKNKRRRNRDSLAIAG